MATGPSAGAVGGSASPQGETRYGDLEERHGAPHPDPKAYAVIEMARA